MAGTHYQETPISCLCSTLRLPTGSQLLSVYLGLGRRLKISAALGGAAGSHTQPDPHPEAHAYPFSRRESGWALRKACHFQKRTHSEPAPVWVAGPLGVCCPWLWWHCLPGANCYYPGDICHRGSLAGAAVSHYHNQAFLGHSQRWDGSQLLLSPRPALLGCPSLQLSCLRSHRGGKARPPHVGAHKM